VEKSLSRNWERGSHKKGKEKISCRRIHKGGGNLQDDGSKAEWNGGYRIKLDVEPKKDLRKVLYLKESVNLGT